MIKKQTEKRGRPKGRRNYSVLNGKEEVIRGFLQKGFAKSEIARILNVPYTNMVYFIRTRNLR